MLIDDLKWRYATKKMDPAKTVPEEKVERILQAAALAPTSSGTQPFRILLVTRAETKARICEAAHGQSQITDCSHLLVFAAWDNYTAPRIDEVAGRMVAARPGIAERMTHYYARLRDSYLGRDARTNAEHAARQAYIAFGMAIAQAAEEKVDTTPMEGFDPERVDEILGLQALGLRSVTLLPLGYRASEGDWLADQKKVRRPLADLVIRLD